MFLYLIKFYLDFFKKNYKKIKKIYFSLSLSPLDKKYKFDKKFDKKSTIYIN